MNNRNWGWIATAIGILAIILLYTDVILHPDSFMFGAYGDSVKNYFTFAWHVRYDTNWLHFGGMNYPFGDHVCYTDGHPIVSLLLGHFGFVKQYPVGTLNMLMLLSQILGIFSVYLLLKELGLQRFVAAIGGLSMIWMQPTMFRMLGHFSLSHVWAIPFALYLLVKYWNSSKSIWIASLAVYCIFLFFLHPYYGMMVSLIPFCTGILDFTLNALYRKSLSRSGLFILSGILAPAFYLAFLKLTDTHPERPDKALGFLIHTSSIDDILVSSLPPFKHFMSQIIKVERQNWEGSAYIGLATMLILVVFTGFQLYNFKKAAINPDNLFMRLLGAGIIILLFSFGFPFKYGFEQWLNYVPFIEQFRAPGRFAWVFFFIVVSFAFYILNSWCIALFRNGKRIMAFGLPLLVFGVFFAEGYIPQTGMAIKAQKNKNTLTTEPQNEIRTELKRIKGQNFEAIIPVPFFHYGTDYLFLSSDYGEQKLAYELAYHAGVPLMASSDPRASLIETRAVLNYFSPPHVNKSIRKQLPSDGLFYVYNLSGREEVQNNYYLPRRIAQISMLQERLTYQNLKTAIANFDTSTIKSSFSKHSNSNFLISIRNSTNGDDKMKASTKQIIELDTRQLADFKPKMAYEASVMLYAKNIHRASIDFVLERIHNNDIQLIKRTNVNESFHHYSDSALCVLTFMAPDSTGSYKLTLKGTPENKLTYQYNHFLLREKSELVLSIDSASGKTQIKRINNFATDN